MRINPVNLNQALSRAQSAGIAPAPKVIAKPAMASSSAIDEDGMEIQSVASSAVRPTSKRKKRRSRNTLNLDGLGSEVDVWA